MINILVIDDEQENVNIITKFAKLKGYNAVGETDPIAGLKLAQTTDFDLIILDVVMPELDGFSLLEQLDNVATKNVIFLSARGSTPDRINGLKLGAIDYMIKPFSIEELFLKIANIISTTKPKQIKGDIVLNPQTSHVLIDGQEVRLSSTLYRLLDVLVSNPNTVYSRDQLLELVWNTKHSGSNRTVDTHILKLRNLLGSKSYKLLTVKGQGYMYED